jgi:adenine-specific DNA-methyltransferase
VKLAIEVNGGQHYEDDAETKDALRTARLEALGLRVLRFTNTDVLLNPDSVAMVIHEALRSPSP